MNGHLEEIHQDDDEEDEAAEHNLDPDRLWEAASEVEEIEGETAEELGRMSPRERQDAMFMLTKVSFAPALCEPCNLPARRRLVWPSVWPIQTSCAKNLKSIVSMNL